MPRWYVDDSDFRSGDDTKPKSQAAHPPTVVHVPIPEGNESRYVEVLREQSLKPCPGCNQSDGWCECPDDCKCAWCVEAAQPVAEPSNAPVISVTADKVHELMNRALGNVVAHLELEHNFSPCDAIKSANQLLEPMWAAFAVLCNSTLLPSSSGPAEPSVTLERICKALDDDRIGEAGLIAMDALAAIKAQALREEAERIEGTHPGVAFGLRNRASELSAAPSSSGLPKMPMGEAAPKEWPAPDYKREAEALTPSSSGREMDCDCPCDICAIGTGKHCGNPPCDVPPSSGLSVDEIALIARKYFPATAQIPTQSYDQQQCIAAITEALSQQAGRAVASLGAEEIARQEVRDWLYAHNALRSGPFTLEQLVDLFAMHAREWGTLLTRLSSETKEEK